MKDITEHLMENEENKELIERWVNTITLKDILIYSNEDFSKKYNTMLSDVEYM